MQVWPGAEFEFRDLHRVVALALVVGLVDILHKPRGLREPFCTTRWPARGQVQNQVSCLFPYPLAHTLRPNRAHVFTRPRRQ